MAHDHDVYMLLVDTAAEEEDLANLKKFTPLLEELALRDGHQLYTGISHRAWGIIHRLEGERSECEEKLREALAIFQGLNTSWQIGKTYFQMGISAKQFRDQKVASEHFASALEEFEILGAIPDIERSRMEIDASKSEASIASI